jgi:hypothetical protein
MIGTRLRISYLGRCPHGIRSAHIRAEVDTVPAVKEVTSMEWTMPEFAEVKMDAEINSYEDDFAGI